MPRFTEERTAFARLVCEAVGLDPSKVSRLELVLDAKDVTRLRVEMLATHIQPALGDAIKFLSTNLVAGNIPFEVVLDPQGSFGWNIGHTDVSDSAFDELDSGAQEATE